MRKIHKTTLLVILGIIILISALVIIYNLSQRETYMSDDPLYGSFTAENKKPSEPPCPADFLLSIDVPTSNETLVNCAKENNVDISKGCWVYSFDENKIFEAEKKGTKLQVYENNQVIGVFEYSSTKILWISYDEKYTANWRGKKLNLTRVLQGFVFP